VNTTQTVRFRRSSSSLGWAAGVRLRPTGIDDAAGLTAMLNGLSVTSSYFRFLSGVRSPSERMVARLLQRDSTHGAWLAGVGDLVVGHVMWALADDAVELGVVVTDAWQGRGVGRWLIRAALAEAVVAGAIAVRLDVHVENGRVIGMLRRSMPDAVVMREAEMLTYLAPMTSAMVASPA
jgi:GNAT superfamily N-acetyltransferase